MFLVDSKVPPSGPGRLEAAHVRGCGQPLFAPVGPKMVALYGELSGVADGATECQSPHII